MGQRKMMKGLRSFGLNNAPNKKARLTMNRAVNLFKRY